MFYVLLAVIGIAAVAVYLLVIFREVPGAITERWGELEGFPQNLGEWVVDERSEAGRAAMARGQRREERTWRDPGSGWFGRDRLVLQVRYRDVQTGQIDRVEPDVQLSRRRIKPGREG